MSAQRGIFARPSQRGNDISAVRGKFSPRLREGLQVCANFLRPFLCSPDPKPATIRRHRTKSSLGGKILAIREGDYKNCFREGGMENTS